MYRAGALSTVYLSPGDRQSSAGRKSSDDRKRNEINNEAHVEQSHHQIEYPCDITTWPIAYILVGIARASQPRNLLTQSPTFSLPVPKEAK